MSFSLLLVAAPVLRGQTTGEIQGTIADTRGSPLAGVTVEAASPNLQGVRSFLTRRDGRYRFPGVPPGVYRVKATLSMFGPEEKTMTVSLDSAATVDMTLELAVREEVIVAGGIPLLDVTATTGGTNYTAKVISRLPVNRNYADIVRSNPGVVDDQGDTQGRSLPVSIYGATSAENQWIIDGIDTTNVVKGIQGKAINNEFVEEVEVKTGGYQAEYGRALGGVITVITKSGGNAFHGDGFFYYDSLPLKARRKITEEDSNTDIMRVADYERRDFGADLGGFLLKDRLWFFAAYDRVELPGKVSRYASTPLVPNTLQFPLDGTDSLYSGKVTWNIATGSTLVATVFADPTTISGAGGADPGQGQLNGPPSGITNPDPGTWQSTRFSGGTDYALRLNQLFGSAALLTLQGARHRDRYELDGTGPGERIRINDFTCDGGTPTNPCRPSFNFATGGRGGAAGDRTNSRRDQYRADLNLYPGNHDVKLGGDYQEAETVDVLHFSGGQLVNRYNDRGQTYYRHYFHARSPTDLTPVDNVARPKTADLGAYLQDSWKVAPGLTVNVGLRWDEEDIRNYQNLSVIKTTAEWQPRLGVIWDPRKDGKTKVYASAGRSYYALPTSLSVLAYGADTTAFTYNFDPASVEQDPTVPGHAKASVFGSAFGDPVDHGLKGIFQDEFTAGLERLVSPTFSIGLKATYRRLGNAIEDRCDLDYTRPETNQSSCGIVNPGSNGKMARGDIPGCNGLDDPFLQCSETIPSLPAAHRLYRGIELIGRKSFSNRVWLQASYAYSSLRGNYDGGVSESGYVGTTPGISYGFDYPQLTYNAYGRLFLDRPHSLRVDSYYVSPIKLSVGLGAFYRSGAPLNKFGYLNSIYSAAAQLVPMGSAGRMPPSWDANLTLAYPVAVGPATATVQVYAFNLFNNQIPTMRDEVWTDVPSPSYPASIFDPNQPQTNPNYGKITSRQGPRLLRAAVRISF